MHANDLAYIPHLHFVARIRDGRSTKTSDLLKRKMFYNLKNLPLVPQYQKRLLQMSTISVRNIHNHVKVEKTSATCNNKRWFEGNLHVAWLETGNGRLIAGNTHDIFTM